MFDAKKMREEIEDIRIELLHVDGAIKALRRVDFGLEADWEMVDGIAALMAETLNKQISRLEVLATPYLQKGEAA